MTITDRVRNILKASHKARNSGKELEIIYMQKSGMNLTPEQEETFRNMDDLWTVRRQMQTIQGRGEYPPDPEVAVARKAKGRAVARAAKQGEIELEEAITSLPQLEVFMKPKPVYRPLDWHTGERML
jgi:hypothetical protein